ncbi:MAG: hypothetical protein ACTSWP_10735 [Candidatus Freyarchaeota archaeon]
MARKSRKSRRAKTMFYSPPRHRDLGEIVSIRSPEEARASAKVLVRMAQEARTRRRKVTIKRAMVLAANRAEAAAKKQGLSAKEKREMREVARIYRRYYKQIEV